MLGLDSGEVAVNGADRKLGRRRRVGAVEAEEVVAEAVEEAGIPAKGSRGEGMTDIVVAITEGTLVVLPGLALEDGGESEEKDGAIVIGEEGREVEAGAELEGVVFGGVVGEERGGEGGVTVGERRRKEVGFGGVEVAAARVDAEGSGGEAGGLHSSRRIGRGSRR